MAHKLGFGMVATLAALSLAGCASGNVHPSATAATSPSQAAPPIVAPPSPTSSPSLPTGFQPERVSAISDSDFWVLGTIGCTPTACPPVILHTVDAGKTFQDIPAPTMIFLDGNPLTPGLPRIFDLRFADASDGWVFGDQLWATHDGGEHWRQISLGLTVDQLEPGASGYVYSTLENCPASGSPCVYRLMRSQAATDTWSDISPLGSPVGRPVIGVHGDTLWVMYFNRGTPLEWISHDDGRLWVRGSMPCEPDLLGSFDPVSTSVIWAFCATGNFGEPWVSSNGGATFTTSPSAAGESSNGATVAALSAEHAFVVDPGAGMLRVTTDGGRTFHPIAQLAGAQWAGFTDSEVGYVIVSEQPSGAMRLWRTTDAGAEWSMVSLA